MPIGAIKKILLSSLKVGASKSKIQVTHMCAHMSCKICCLRKALIAIWTPKNRRRFSKCTIIYQFDNRPNEETFNNSNSRPNKKNQRHHSPIWSFAAMRSQMRFQCAWASVRFATQPTQIWLRFGLNAIVAVFILVAEAQRGHFAGSQFCLADGIWLRASRRRIRKIIVCVERTLGRWRRDFCGFEHW